MSYNHTPVRRVDRWRAAAEAKLLVGLSKPAGNSPASPMPLWPSFPNITDAGPGSHRTAVYITRNLLHVVVSAPVWDLPDLIMCRFDREQASAEPEAAVRLTANRMEKLAAAFDANVEGRRDPVMRGRMERIWDAYHQVPVVHEIGGE